MLCEGRSIALLARSCGAFLEESTTLRSSAIVAVILLALAAPFSWATVYVVTPDGTGDYPTIQAAIDAAVDGDVIELASGTFHGSGNRDIDYGHKSVTVRSISGDPTSCIIDCEGSPSAPHWGLWFLYELPAAVLQGVTVTHGYDDMASGGGVYCAASVAFVDCVFADNTSAGPYGGGGVNCALCSPSFTNCRFEGNTADAAGGGLMFLYGGSPRFDRCTFVGNVSYGGGGCAIGDAMEGELSAEFTDCVFSGNSAGLGGGLFCWGEATASLDHCTITGNVVTAYGAGVHVEHDLAGVTLSNTIVAFNLGGEGIHCGAGGSATLTCCDVFGNSGGDWVGCIEGQLGIEGNICEDPLFCGSGSGDFTLHADSPCAPEHNPECGLIGAWPVGCEETPVEKTTWGAIKAMFRE